MNRINPYRVSLAQLRRRTGYSDKTLIRHLRALEAAGVLKVTRSQGTTPSRYAVMTPEPFSA
jgi:DNA-binding HxlR family transcriptional regulator